MGEPKSYDCTETPVLCILISLYAMVYYRLPKITATKCTYPKEEMPYPKQHSMAYHILPTTLLPHAPTFAYIYVVTPQTPCAKHLYRLNHLEKPLYLLHSTPTISQSGPKKPLLWTYTELFKFCIYRHRHITKSIVN